VLLLVQGLFSLSTIGLCRILLVTNISRAADLQQQTWQLLLLGLPSSDQQAASFT
jgi:hypothetical protein